MLVLKAIKDFSQSTMPATHEELVELHREELEVTKGLGVPLKFIWLRIAVHLTERNIEM